MIMKVERENSIHGIKVSRQAIPISYISSIWMISLLFSKAEENEAHSILNILSLYSAMSGQSLNLTKSGILFSNYTEEIQKKVHY